MRRLGVVLALSLMGGLAQAADQPVYAPPAAWVKPHEPAKPIGPDTTTPTRLLLEDMQVNFDGGARESYWDGVTKIQTPQGLAGVGNLGIAWRPDTETLTIHKLHIIRGDQVIDLLANGRTFTVLRRENNLEMAMLDGALTAVIEPEGLQVGDLVDFAFTLRRADPVLQGKAEWQTANLVLAPVDRLMVREIWPKSKALRFRQTDGLSEAKVSATADGSELTITMDNAQPPKGPKGAPARFFQLGQIEGTEFKSWAEVSALMAPLFDKAGTLNADSPLKAEAAKIKAASGDPKVQAMAALKLVEDQVRYLFLGMNNGGYVPADADQTWSRRFGDCKGKTALLIALLHELGIEAEPALASVMNGDGLNERLPMLEKFDHVLVRAVVGGKVYWLDGTRSGDRNLDDLPTPAFHWLLPVQKSGAELVKLTVPVPEKPLTDMDIYIDASAGLNTPAKVHAVVTFRADAAIRLNLRLKSTAQAELDKNLREYWKKTLDWVEIGKIDSVYDEATGEERFTMEGTGPMEWRRYLGGRGRQYQIDGARLGWKADFDREPGSRQDAPFQVVFPFFEQTKETIRLPAGGEGFLIDATDVDKTTGGMAFNRVTRIQDGLLTMVATVKAMISEFPASAADQTRKELRAMDDVAVYLHAPDSYVPADENNAPVTAEDFVQRAYGLHRQQRYDDAIADLTRAIALKPDYAKAYTSRGLAYLAKDAYAEAQADFAKALQLAPNEEAAMRGDAVVLSKRRKYPEAADELTRALAIKPDDEWALMWRGVVNSRMKAKEKALADLEAALKLKPEFVEVYRFRSAYFASLHKGQEALADAEKDLAIEPDSADAHGLCARALILLGRDADAERELALMLPEPPTAEAYLQRARIRDPSDIDGQTADVDAALKLKPASPEAASLKINLNVITGDFEGADALLERAIARNPDDIGLLRRRAILRADRNQLDSATEDFNRIAARKPDNLIALLDACRVHALAAKDFDATLAACQAAIKLDPSSDAAKEARGFAYLRFGRFDAAKADYADVLTRWPRSEIALYGWGQAETKAGGDGEMKLAAARAEDQSIESDFVAFRPLLDASLDDAIEAAWAKPAPATAEALIARGGEYVSAGLYTLAAVDFTLALKRDPKSSPAFAGRGKAYLRDGMIERAAADFDKAIQLDANQVTALEGQGVIAKRRGDSGTAIALFTRVLALKPDDTEARIARAAVLADEHRYDDALEEMAALIGKGTDNPVWLNDRCWYRALAGKDLLDALADCDASLKIQDVAATRDSRGLVDLRLGKLDDAVVDYDKALSLQPNMASSLYGRGIAKVRKGAASEGQADMTAAIAIDPKVEKEFAGYGLMP